MKLALMTGVMLSCLWGNVAHAGTGDDAAGAAPATPAAAPAPQDAGGPLQDIVVTAQRRSQKLQDVGIAITAFNGAQMHQLGFTSSTDLAKMAPNVAISTSFGGQTSQFTMRGVTQSDYNDHVESVIAVYVDDTYIAMQQGQMFGLFDVDHVEILKGPQGTLFGRNATGGVVNYLTKRPTDRFDGYLDATYGSYNNVRLEGGVGGALVEGVRGRLSGFYERYDGYIKNTYPEQTYVPAAYQAGLGKNSLPGAGSDLGGVKGNWALRGQIEADLGPKTQLWISATYNTSVASTGPYQNKATVAVLDSAGNIINAIDAAPNQTCQGIQNGQCVHMAYSPYAGTTRPVAGGDFYGYRDPDGNGPLTASDYTFGNANTFTNWGFSAKLTSDLGFATLTSISDFKHFDKDFSLDLEAGPENQFVWHNVANEKTFSQELRLNGKSGGLTWVTGGYFLYVLNHSASGLGALPESTYSFPAFDQPRVVKLDTKSYSAFAQVEYAVKSNLSLIGGVRVSREVKDYDFQVLLVTPTTGLDPYHWNYSPTISFPGFSQDLYQGHLANTLWSWKGQIDWHPAEKVLIYAGVTQGAKSGSFNAGGPPLAVSAIPYKPERLISYEAGIKSTWFDRRLRFNAAGFYYDYKNYQAAQWLGASTLIINADAYIYGGEAELAATPVNNLDMSVNLGYQTNKVKNVPVGGQLLDRQVTFAPHWTLSGLLRYSVPKPVAGGKMAFQIDGSYQSSSFQNLNNFSANKMPGWGIMNLKLDWTAPDPRWQVSVFARNVLNSWYQTGGFDLSAICGCNEVAVGKPRWIGGQVRYSFR